MSLSLDVAALNSAFHGAGAETPGVLAAVKGLDAGHAFMHHFHVDRQNRRSGKVLSAMRTRRRSIPIRRDQSRLGRQRRRLFRRRQLLRRRPRGSGQVGLSLGGHAHFMGVFLPMAVIVVELFPMSVKSRLDPEGLLAVHADMELTAEELTLRLALLLQQLGEEVVGVQHLNVLDHAFPMREALVEADRAVIFGLLFGVHDHVGAVDAFRVRLQRGVAVEAVGDVEGVADVAADEVSVSVGRRAPVDD